MLPHTIELSQVNDSSASLSFGILHLLPSRIGNRGAIGKVLWGEPRLSQYGTTSPSAIHRGTHGMTGLFELVYVLRCILNYCEK